MDLTDFETIIAVADCGTISQAAKKLNRVPSAITTRVQNLESQLGVSLFVKENRQFILTVRGKFLYGHAVKIIEMVADVQQQVKSPSAGGIFKLGALDSMASVRLPKPLAQLYKNHQNIAVELSTGISRSLYNAVLERQIDAAFLADAPNNDKLSRIAVFKEELVIITAVHHLPVMSPCDLEHDTLLVFQDGCSYRDRLTSWFKLHNTEPKRLAEINSYHAILGAVSAGMGVGIIPRSLIQTFPSPELIEVHDFKSDNNYIVTELIWRKAHLTPNIQVLLDILSTQADPALSLNIKYN